MRYDVAIAGGGLSALLAGVKAAKAGKSVVMASAGGCSLLYSKPYLDAPLDPVTAETLADFGIKLYDGGYRLTCVGEFVPCAHAVRAYHTIATDDLSGRCVLVVNVKGFVDFPTSMLAAGLEKHGAKCEIVEFTTPSLDLQRSSLTEFRATNIAKVFARESESMTDLCSFIQSHKDDCDLVVLPSVFMDAEICTLGERLGGDHLLFVSPLPPSVAGYETIDVLEKVFVRLGGTLLRGQSAVGGIIDGGAVKFIRTDRLGSYEPIEADTYILATGTFISKGLRSDYTHIWEPLFDLDVDAPEGRGQWLNENFYGTQPYQSVKVHTDQLGHAYKAGVQISNLYVIGHIAGASSDSDVITSAFKLHF